MPRGWLDWVGKPARSFVLGVAFFKRNWLKPVAANCLPSKLKVPSMDLLLAFRILSIFSCSYPLRSTPFVASAFFRVLPLLSVECRIFFCLGRCGKVNEWQYATNNSGHARCRRCPCRLLLGFLGPSLRAVGWKLWKILAFSCFSSGC